MQYKNETYWKYEYNLSDHLGNVRIVFAAHSHGQPELIQQTIYYPYGMTLHQQNFGGTLDQPNKMLYNGKELQDDQLAGKSLDWYDYGARFYDPQIGRWHVVDPLAEKYPYISGFAYVANNPIKFVDPDGRDIVDANGNIVYTHGGGWSKNAPVDAMRIGNAMMATRTGRAQFNKMVDSNTKIQLEISQAEKVSGRRYTLGQMVPGKARIDANGKVQLLDAKVVIYEGTINKFMNDSKNSKNDKAVSYHMNTTNNDERIAAVAGHEAEHLTQENVQQNYENVTQNASHDIERKPNEVEMRILNEIGWGNIKPIEPIREVKIEIQ
ncbi:MAG: RHS repeat-associated core domain-containing protein [Bacteroidales bacterium]|nr:RHS repeat-associated core domain-containing protein [Bacteroidales bacterium]